MDGGRVSRIFHFVKFMYFSDHTNEMDVFALVPLPVRISPDFCSKRDAQGRRGGVGLAVCRVVDLLVISCLDTVCT
jgi:hypothetical protein